MDTIITKIFATYDHTFRTWNVMDMNNNCLFYGTIDELEEWLEEHKENYQDQLH